jgi:hypothetical protein
VYQSSSLSRKKRALIEQRKRLGGSIVEISKVRSVLVHEFVGPKAEKDSLAPILVIAERERKCER